MSKPTPVEIAEADQHWAMVDADLTELITSYRTDDLRTRIEALDYLVEILACPHLDDGTEMPHEAHISTIAYLAAAAIDRLARKDTDA